jgi:hypothetical protein
MMIRAFIDDSEGADIFVLAGWVTDYKTWDSFTDDWRATLDESPKINYFKHHEAKGEPPTGQFEGWSADDVSAKMQRLTEVICRHDMYGVICGINMDDYRAAFAGSVLPFKQLRTFMKNIHHFSNCVHATASWVLKIQLHRGKTEDRVDLVFDEMEGLMADCIAFYDSAKNLFPEDMKNIAGILTEGNDKEVEALQAADFLAGQCTTARRLGNYETYYRQMEKAHEIYQLPAYMPSFDQIPELIRLFNMAWSTEQLKRSASKVAGVEPKVE